MKSLRKNINRNWVYAEIKLRYLNLFKITSEFPQLGK
jgi:hypothetical protein